MWWGRWAVANIRDGSSVSVGTSNGASFTAFASVCASDGTNTKANIRAGSNLFYFYIASASFTLQVSIILPICR